MIMAMAHFISDVALFVIVLCALAFFVGYILAATWTYSIRNLMPKTTHSMSICRLQLLSIFFASIVLCLSQPLLMHSGLLGIAAGNSFIGFSVGITHFI
jgi:hypothetical protein